MGPLEMATEYHNTRRARPPGGDWFRSFFDRDYVEVLGAQSPPRITRLQVDFLEEELRLRPGMSVLDVGCGFGRHAAELARRGYRATGVDLSRAMLAEGRRRFGKRRNLTLVKGDMRRLPYRGEFDAVISFFSSFGYFKERENLATLRGMARALKKGGRLLIDGRDLAWAKRNIRPRNWWTVGRGRFVLEEAKLDGRSGRVESSWWIITPQRRRVLRKRFLLRMYDRAGWRALLRRAGLSSVRFFSERNMARAAGPRLIVLARKP